MINNIYKTIQNKSGISFQNIQKTLQQEGVSIDNTTYSEHLSILIENKKVIYHQNLYYDSEQLPLVTGFAQWDILGKCWFSKKDHSNEFGISYFFDSQIHIPIINKHDTFYSHKVECRLLTINEQKYAFVISSKKYKHINLLVKYNKEIGLWSTLNSKYSFSFFLKHNANHGDVYLYQEDQNTLNEYMCNISDVSAKDYIISLISNRTNIKPPPHNENYNKNTLPLSNKLFFTIDSDNSTILDDAISFEENEEGYLLTVAISYILPYLHSNKEAADFAFNQAFNLYLTSQVHPIFDYNTAKLHSLDLGEKRDAILCEIQYNHNLDKISHKFSLSQIISQAKLTNSMVHKVLESSYPKPLIGGEFLDNDNSIRVFSKENTRNDILQSLHLLYAFSTVKSKQPVVDLFYFKKEININLNEDGTVNKLYFNNYHIAENIIETCMKEVNLAAAEFILQSSLNLPKLFRNQTTDNLNASYSPENQGHFIIQSDQYTHFTAPLRRSTDIIAQQFIENCILNNNINLQELNYNRINFLNKKYKKMAIRIKELYIEEYLKDIIKNNELDSIFIITDFNDKGITVRNHQLIQLFIPLHKIENTISNYLKQNLELPLKEKIDLIEELNHNHDIYIDISYKKEKQLVTINIQKL